MTGFGAAEGTVGGSRVTVELRSVNHRFFNSTIRLPAELARWEGDVREAVRRRVSRGHVTVTTRLERSNDALPRVSVERLETYIGLLRGIRDRFQISGDVDLATLMRMPDVLQSPAVEEEGTVAELLTVVETATEALNKSRQLEGGRLEVFLRERLDVVEGALCRIEARAPQRLIEARERLKENVRQLVEGVAVDEARLAMEIAILADRLDVSEEVARFRSHIAAFREALSAGVGEAVGKRLGFILQEMLREGNTTGSKANDAAILADVVTIKEELERIREQVENLE